MKSWQRLRNWSRRRTSEVGTARRAVRFKKLLSVASARRPHLDSQIRQGVADRVDDFDQPGMGFFKTLD